jgi:uncharacterized protein
MDATAIIEEQVRFGAGPALTGILGYPAGGGAAEPVRAVLLCSPHPHFAGDMNNNVIKALACGLAADSVALRFDYRGVGDSQVELPDGLSVFDYWDEVERTKDYRDALADIGSACAELTRIAAGLPLFVVGYSFGAATGLTFGLDCPAVRAMAGISPPLTRVDFGFLAECPSAKPCLLLCGKNDFVYSPAEAARLAGASAAGLIVEQLDGSDHFFRGQEDDLCRRVRKFLTEGT